MIAQVPPLDQTDTEKATYIRLCHLDDLPIGLGRAFNVDGKIIAVFRTRSGRLFAVDNRCPHKGGPLAEGMLAGEFAVCPLHAFRFDMHSGQCDQPAICAVATYAIAEREGEIYLSPLARGK